MVTLFTYYIEMEEYCSSNPPQAIPFISYQQ